MRRPAEVELLALRARAARHAALHAWAIGWSTPRPSATTAARASTSASSTSGRWRSSDDDAPRVAQPLGWQARTRSVWQGRAPGEPLRAGARQRAARAACRCGWRGPWRCCMRSRCRPTRCTTRRTGCARCAAAGRRSRARCRRWPGASRPWPMRSSVPPSRCRCRCAGLIHGDFHAGQVGVQVDAAQRIVFHDFDEFALGDPMEDLAAFVHAAARSTARRPRSVRWSSPPTRRRRRSVSAAAGCSGTWPCRCCCRPAVPSCSRSTAGATNSSVASPVPRRCARPASRRPNHDLRRTAPGSRLRALVRECLAEQRLAIVLAALALAGVVLADVLAPWPLKIIFDHILLARPLPADAGLAAAAARAGHLAGAAGLGRRHRRDRAGGRRAVVPAALHEREAGPPHHLAAARRAVRAAAAPVAGLPPRQPQRRAASPRWPATPTCCATCSPTGRSRSAATRSRWWRCWR